MSDQLILVFSGKGANDAIRGLMAEFADALASIGLPVVHVSWEPTELQYAIDQMARGGVRFALTWLGFGQDLTVNAGPDNRPQNIWELLRVPIVKIHADSPAYFLDRHRDSPSTSVNLYMAAEFAHFHHRWIPGSRCVTGLIPPFPMGSLPRGGVDLAKRRQGKLVFLKNGNSPAALRRLWQEQLPQSSVTNQLAAMADAITAVGLRPGTLHIGEFVADFLSSRSVDPETVAPLIPFFTAQLDDYLRRVKSELIASALLDFPVIVQGSLWDHVNFAGRRAQLVPGQDFATSRRIFTDELGVIDMSPNMDAEPHERVMRAAGSYSVVLTNRQSWIQENFSQFQDLEFEFNAESIRDRVASVLSNPDHYLELGIAFGEHFRNVHPVEDFARRVVEVADLAALQYAAEKPRFQDFFVWPAP